MNLMELQRALRRELSGAVRKSVIRRCCLLGRLETVTLGYPVEPVAEDFLG
jgi:hypothetical protein